MRNGDSLDRLNHISDFGLDLYEKRRELNPYMQLAKMIAKSPLCQININEGEVVSGTSGTEGEPSFGMGLKHVKEFVTRIDGAIEVTSTPGEGTQFSVSLPIR